ncbi:tetratricopeptide repeat protein [Xanthobacter oligotrophicus]|uniref:tetratricopeptide repeat protein n=1 Tax=Xanthobacter oligotrophicus TaxID=2607286 RepID=UPI0011F3F51D|nr:hypothetical protein [Xanthobacter oligotrophicus]MCG5236165.1 hypothetical protein [Xanthobacter oligotrophicus]
MRPIPRAWPTNWPTRRLIDAALLALGVAAFGMLLALGARIGLNAFENRTITALADGRDVPVADTATPRLLLARAHFLMVRDRFDEAQPLVDRLSRTDERALAVAGLYDLANARLARAIAHLEQTEIDPAIPLVRLAKAGYRAALERDPGFWDAKYNLDIAMRLIRDFPQIEQEPQDDAQETPKRLWTDLPGLPQGLP